MNKKITGIVTIVLIILSILILVIESFTIFKKEKVSDLKTTPIVNPLPEQ